MPAVTGHTASGLGEQVARRLAGIDALLPAAELPAGCGSGLAVTGPDGSVSAEGTCEHWAGEPGSLEMTWGAARRFQLTPQVAGPDVGAALDDLLTRWHEHLAALPDAAEADSAAVVTWPTRDIDGARPLLRHGLAPRAVIAARTAGRRPRARPLLRHGLAPRAVIAARPRPAVPAAVPVDPAVRIRRACPGGPRRGRPARPGDDPVRRPLRHRDRAAGDARRAAPRGRPGAGRPRPVGVAGRAGRGPGRPALRRTAGARGLDRPDGAGGAGGLPGADGDAARRAGPRGRRRAGRGAAPGRGRIRGGGHAAALRAGQPAVRAVLDQQGYRPLWTSWEARPASTLR